MSSVYQSPLTQIDVSLFKSPTRVLGSLINLFNDSSFQTVSYAQVDDTISQLTDPLNLDFSQKTPKAKKIFVQGQIDRINEGIKQSNQIIRAVEDEGYLLIATK